MTHSRKISTLIIPLTILVAICISSFFLVAEKNAQLALMSMIIPLSLSSYLYPRYIYLAFLFIINAGGLYLLNTNVEQLIISAADLVVFNLVSIFSSELIIYLKTSHSRAIEKLTKLDFLHQNIISSINEGITILKNGKVFFVNDQLCNITGYSHQEMNNLSFLGMACPDEKHKLSVESFDNPDSLGNHQTISFWIKNKNGEKRFIENTYFYFQSNADEAIGLIFTYDLTEPKKIENTLSHSQKSLARLLSNLPGMAYRCKNDDDWTMEYVSEGAKDLTGYPPDALINNKIISYGDLIYPEDRLAIRSQIQKKIDANELFQFAYRINTANQEIRWVWGQGRAVQNIDNKSGKVLEGFITDITDRVLANQALSQSEQQYKTLANSITDVFLALDNTLTITYWNKASEELTGVSSQGTIGKSIYKIFQTIQGSSLDIALQEAIKHQKSGRFIQKLKINDDKEPFLEINIYPSSYGVAIFGRDVTERIEAENQLKYLSTHDALTRIYSRAYFETEMERLQNSRLFPISIVMADLDGLKYVNDNQGHSAGDELLRKTAKLLRESFRNEDVVARIGGDEFGVLIANTGMDAVHKALKRVRSKIQDHNKTYPNLKIKLSIGVATSQIGENLEDTSRRADKKMYADKSTHKGDTRELKPY